LKPSSCKKKRQASLFFISGIFDIPSTWSCIKAISHEVDCIRSLCHSLFLLVVDLPNGSDFPKPVGNTAIQYFLSMRHSRIVLCNCFNSSMPNSGKISGRSAVNHIAWRLPCFFLHNTEDTEKAVLWLVVLWSLFYFWLANINFR